ncbi:MAG: A24 family peptidase C-terminal domain-containing protein, partial [Thermoplasmata archaeon]
SYPLSTDRLTEEFVWVRDPRVDPAEEDLPTSEEDQELRVRQQAALRVEGITEVWVTPQLPFLVLLLAGAVAALLLGNVLFDLLALL